jgi:hypothetical protein
MSAKLPAESLAAGTGASWREPLAAEGFAFEPFGPLPPLNLPNPNDETHAGVDGMDGIPFTPRFCYNLLKSFLKSYIMQEMPRIQRVERGSEDINKRIESILGEKIEEIDLKILSFDRQKVFIKFVECLEKLKNGEADDDEEDFARDIFWIIKRNLDVILDEFEEYGRIKSIYPYEELKGALYDFYLVLLTSLTDEELPRVSLGSEIRKKIGNIKISDFKRIMKIWEDNEEGTRLFYRVDEDKKRIIEEKIWGPLEKSKETSSVVEVDGGFGCFFRPDPEFWKSLFASIIEEREAEFMEGLTKFVLRARELLERLTKINFPPNLEEVIFEGNERKREKKLEKLSEEDRRLAENVISIQKGVLNVLNKIKALKEKKKEISPDEWHILLTRKLEALEEEIKSYENSIKELEEKFRTKALEKKEEEKRKETIFGGIGQWIQENFGDVAPLFGYFGLIALLFLPIKLLRSMQETFETRSNS